MPAPWKKSYNQPRQHIKKQRHYFANKSPSSKIVVFQVVKYRCWELDRKESWAPKNWCFWTVVLEKTLESPLDCKEIKLVNPEGNQSWIFTGRTDAESPVLWPPDARSQLIEKDPYAGKDWRQEETGMTEDAMIGWHHWLEGHKFEQALGVGDGQPWHAAVHGLTKSWKQLSDWMDWLNGQWTDWLIISKSTPS